MPPICAHYVFHPVGQGLFASGALFDCPHPYLDRHSPMFRWVYDCGTTSSQSLIKREIDRLYHAAFNVGTTKPTLDLVAISHFDKDHISGIEALLGKFHVKNLILPYLPLWQRIMLAFDQSVAASSKEMDFFLNPISYINGIEGAEIGQILLIQASDEGTSDNNPDDNNNIPPEGSDSPWNLVFEENDQYDQVQQQDFGVFKGALQKTRLAMLRPGSALRTARKWEFVPYNDCLTYPKPPPSFLASVAVARITLLNATDKETREAILTQLKTIYDKQFGKTHKARNGISLHLYGGPIGQTKIIAIDHSCSQPLGDRCCHPRHCFIGCCCSSDFEYREKGLLGILYTGDAYLDTKAKLDRLMNYLGMPHRRNLLCLQVMHHGARSNWHAGVSNALVPAFSVFSSDPKGRHPHTDVWNDFANFGRKQVNKNCGVSVCASYW